MAEDKVTNLYKTFVTEGYEMEPESEFRENIKDPKKRRAAYDALVSDGYDMEPFEEFERNIGFSSTSAPQRQVLSSTVKTGDLIRTDSAINNIDSVQTPSDGALPLVSDTLQTQTGQTGSPHSFQAFQRGGLMEPRVMREDDKPDEADAPVEGGWGSAEDYVAMMEKVNAAGRDFMRKSDEMMDAFHRSNMPMTKEGRRELHAREMEALMKGDPTRVLPIRGELPKVGDEPKGSKDEVKTEAKETVLDPRSPVPYGYVKNPVTGKEEQQWMLPDGTLTTDIFIAGRIEGHAGDSRKIADRMRRYGLDHSKESDRKAYELVDAVRGDGDPDLKRMVTETMERNGMDVNDDEALKALVSGDDRKILDYRLAKAEKRLKELIQRRNAEEDKARAERSWWEEIGHSFNEGNRHNHPTYHKTTPRAKSDLDKQIEMATAEVVKIDRSISEYENAVKQQGKGVVGKVLQGLWDGITNPNNITMGVLDASVNNSIRNYNSEAGQSLLESAMVAQDMMAKAPETSGLYKGGEFIGGMVIDPTMLIGGEVGAFARGAVMKGFTRGMMKRGIGESVATRLAGQSVAKSGTAAAIGQGVNFATFEGLGDARQQWIDGGYYDEDNHFHKGFSFMHALGKSGHGAAMGTIMGVFGAGVGNVTNRVAGKVSSAAGKAGVKVAGNGVAFVGEGTIFSAEDIYHFQTMDADKFDKLYAEKFGYAEVEDPEKRATARSAARNSLSIDAWTESQLFVAGLRIAGQPVKAIEHPAGFMKDVASRIEELRGIDRRYNISFPERIQRMLRRQAFDVTLDADDLEQLRNAGYDDLASIFVKDKETAPKDVNYNIRKVKVTRNGHDEERWVVDFGRELTPEERTAIADFAVTKLGRTRFAKPVGVLTGEGWGFYSKGHARKALQMVHGEGFDAPRVEAEEGEIAADGHGFNSRSKEFDGYSRLEKVMQDKGISETLRSKLYFIASGKMLPLSTVMGWNKKIEADGSIVVNSISADGGAVTSRKFKSDKDAEKEVAQIRRQAELNTIDVGEKFAEQEAMRTAARYSYEDVARRYGLIPEGVENIFNKALKGERLSEREAAIAESVQQWIGDSYSRSDIMPENIRKYLKKEAGIDVDDVIRKPVEKRSVQEQEVLDEYMSRLYREGERQRGAEDRWKAEAESIRSEHEEMSRHSAKMNREGRLLYEGTKPKSGGGTGPTAEPPRDVQATFDALRARQSEAYEEMVEALGDDAESIIANSGDDLWGLSVDSSLSDSQREAVVRFIDADERLNGFIDAENEDAENKKAVAAQEIERRTHRDRGVVQPVVLMNGQQAYLVKGNVATYADGSIDKVNSDKQLWILNPENGQYEPTSPERIALMGDTVDAAEEVQAAMEAIEAERPVDMRGEKTSDDTLRDGESSVNLQHGNGSEQDNDLSSGNEGNDAGRPVAADTAGSVESDRGRSDIRVYTQGLGTSRDEHSDDSERDRREAESERLVGNPENVPNIAKNAEIPTENRELVTENVPKTEIPVENVQQTPLSRIPRDEQGEPMFEAVDKDTAWDGLVEHLENEDDARAWADGMIKHSQKAVKDAEKALDKVVPGPGGTEAFKKERQQKRAELEAARERLDKWQKIAAVEEERAAAAKAEEEARLAAERQAEEEWQAQKKAMDRRVRDEAERMRDCPEAVELLKHLEPQTIDEVAALTLSGNKILMNDNGRGAFGLRHHTGWGNGEMKKLFGLFAREENGGKSLDRLAEDVMQQWCEQYGVPYDNVEARNALLELLQGSLTVGDIKNYIIRKRLKQASDMYDSWVEQMEAYDDMMYQERYGMSKSDYEAYEEQLFVRYEDMMSDAEIAEALHIEELLKREENERRTETRVAGSDAVLSASPVDNPRGGATPAERGSAAVSSASDGAQRVASAGTSAAGERVEPTEAQKEAGNYKMEHRRIDGYNISIENPKGSVRRGRDASGKEWATTMHHDYGYIRGTEAPDGDHIDIFLSDTPEQGDVFVIDQYNEDGTFDEYKVMYGFADAESARSAYLSNYEEGWAEKHRIEVTGVSKDEFKEWVESSKRKTKPFADYKSIRDITYNVDQTPTNVNKEGMIVDEDGKPLTLYHGTPNDVELTDLEIGHTRAGSDGAARFNGVGISFTPNRDVAVDYASADRGKGKVFEVNVTLKKPYYTLGVANFTQEEAAEFTASLQAKGYDGIINYQSKAMRDGGALPNEVIVFDVKSATPAPRPKNERTVPADPRTMPDNEKARRGDMLRNAPAIEVAVGQIVATKELSARKAAEQWWDKNVAEPAIYDTEVGEVEINKTSVESSLAHKYGQMKLDAVTSLIEGFNNAVYLGTMPDFTRQVGVSNHFFAYPINYNGKRCYVFCRAMQDANKNRLYVHEVFVSDKIKKGDTLQTAASQPHGGIALYRDILANVLFSPNSPEWHLDEDLANMPNLLSEQGNSEISDGKVNTLSADKQAVGNESSNKSGGVPEKEPDEDIFDYAKRVADYDAARRALDEKLAADDEDMRDARDEANRPEGGEDVQRLLDDSRADREFSVEPTKEMTEAERDASGYRLTREDMRKASGLAESKTAKSDAPEVTTDKGSYKMTAEMERKAAELRRLLNGDDEDTVREPSALTAGEARKLHALGVDFACDFIEQGVTAFPEFARAMTEVLGESSKPYLKSWYQGARYLPEYSDKEFTPSEEVERFDVANFDKSGYDLFEDARMRSLEHGAKQVAQRAEAEIVERMQGEAERELSQGDMLIDEFCGRFNEYLDSVEGLSDEESLSADEAMGADMERYRDDLAELLKAEGMEEGDAMRTARETLNRAMGEVQNVRGIRSARHRIEAQPGEAYAESVESSSDEVTKPEQKEIQKYETAGGEVIAFKGYGELPALKPGEVCYVERQFSQTHEFSFTGGDRIESADDVAYLFRELEGYSVEHSFAVLVKEGEQPVIMQLGMGSEASTIVSPTAIRAAYDAMGGADKVYFVHNHPSGILRPSPQDEAMLGKINKMFPEGVVQKGIIIDTTSGQYCQFGNMSGVEQRQRLEESGGQEYPVYRFNRHTFSKDYVMTDDMKAMSDEAVAKIVSSQRLGQRGKQNLLVASNSLQVMGCFVLTDTKDVTAMAKEAVKLTARFGGRRVVLFGNVPMASDDYMRFTEEVSRLSGGEMSVLSNVTVENGLRSEERTEPEAKEEQPEEKDTPLLSPTPEKESGMIDDFGEKLEGARKDILKDIASGMDDITDALLIAQPLSQTFKRPNIKKMVESGALTADEAKVVEAFSLAILGDSKPTVGRSRQSKHAGGMTSKEKATMTAWASKQNERIKALSSYLKGSPEERRAIERDMAESLEATAKKSMNATGLTKTYLPSEALMMHILNKSGVSAGEKWSPVKLGVYQYGGSPYWRLATGKAEYVRIGESLDNALDYMTSLFMLKNGMADVKLPRQLFSVSAKKHERIPTGRYEVWFFGGRSGSDVKFKEFDNLQMAEKFCEQFKSKDDYRLKEIFETGEATEVAITVIDPISNKRIELDERYGSRAEAHAALDEDIEAINSKAVEAILADHKISRKEKVEFEVHHFPAYGGKPEVWAVTKRGQYSEIMSEHKTEAEARAAKEQKEAELRALKEQQKKFDYFRPEVERKGVDHRGGKDATPEMFDEAFGFRGVQFGNWTNQRDRQEALNQAYDGLMDLAAATGLPARALSLNGELGLAFGARGSGSALAHYEPSTVVINLTKTKGKGSLAHEWWHALDNYFGRHSQSKGGFASEGMTEGLRSETAKAFHELQQAVKGSDYAYRSYNRGSYWGSMCELTARLFAEWVDKRGAARGEHSPFLARGVDSGLVEGYKELNWHKYQMLVTQLRRHGDTPKAMTREEFMSSPQALEGFVEVTADELATLGKYVDRLFDEMKFEERGGNTAVFEPDATYDSDNNGIGQKFIMGRGEGHSLDNQGNERYREKPSNAHSDDVASDASVDDESGIKYRLIDDKELQGFLDGQPLKKGYRYSQWANMGVLPPMTAKQNGEWRAPMIFGRWEQSEEGMRKDNGKADLVQGNGRTTGNVAYNPYFHIRTSPLNDQFTAAYDRPELLVVEGYYPESEEESGYRADGAKDSVGLMDWHSGSVNGQLSDETKVQTMLSRYFKPSRIVPWSEVADLIMERVGDQRITFPINAVPPMLRAELAKRGAKFGDISGSVAEADVAMLNDLRDRVNAGEWDAGLERAREYMDAYEGSSEAKEARVQKLSVDLHTPIRVISDQSEIDNLPTLRKKRAKGWWDGRTGEIVIVLPNNVNVADVDNTVVHEVVGHKGLRAFIGEERFDDFLREVYAHCLDSIRKRIDAQTDKMVNEEVERLRKQKQAEHEQAGEDYNSTFFADMAEARVEAEKKREEFRDEATEEYMSDLGGRIGSEGFEKMSRDELTFWGDLKARVQKFLDRFLAGLGIPKSIRLTDKDLAYILFKSWKYAKEGGKADVISEAADVAMRHRTGWDRKNVEPDWKAKTKALTDAKNPIQKETYSAHKDSRMTHQKDAALDSPSKSDVAKVQQICESLKNLSEKIPEKGLGKSEIVYEIASALDFQNASSSNSNYKVVTVAGMLPTTFRISNHSARVHNLGKTSNNVGIVIKTSRHQFTHKADIDYVEFLYYGDRIENNAAIQRAIVDGLRHYIETGSFDRMPEADRLNTSGVYRDAIDGIQDKMRFRDGDMSLEETITKLKVDAMQNNSEDTQARKNAMKAIGGNLNNLRRAMASQRKYDISTVKSVTDLAKIMMDGGLLDGLSKFEMKRLLGTVERVVGKLDVSGEVDKVLDIMVENQLRVGANTLSRLLSIRGSRVDARGIEVQGELDPEGQRIVQVVRKSTSLPKDDIDNHIADALNRMGSADNTIADEASIEYAGLQIARQYVEEITESKAEEKELRDSIKQAKEDKDAGQMTEAAYKQYVKATNDAIRQNKIDRAEAFHSLVEQVGDVMSSSIERAKSWREAEKQRVKEIHHNANSDMEGRPTDEHHKDDRTQKIVNNSFARFLLAPLATFDQMLRMFGKKNTRGEGYLWNRYMRGWVEASEKEYTGYRDALKVLDDKVSEVFGKNMSWGDLFSIDRQLPKASVSFWDGGEMKDHELTQGNLLYIYMADKMSDGRMKLRRMGITEDDIENIKNFLDPKFIQLADWIQEEFLVEKRNEYNEVHKRMFGASMAAIENYFPLKILANARLENVDVADDTADNVLPATSTGSIIKRRRNNLALDVTGANAFSVILDHLQQMERWAAFAEFNRDLNTLLSYKRFRNQVMNMSSAYGAGKTLWNNFRNVCSMAAGAYRPPIAALDKSAVNVAKGVTAAKVSFRLFTALKQFLSMPAYLSDSNPAYLVANIANPIGAWKWSMENLPLFEKRWKSRMAGDPRLLKTDMDWKMWRSRVVEIASRIGMSPNAFVDALTVAIGTRSMYQTKLAKYKRQGYDPDVAEARAKQDATILFNQTQQSSEGAFLSTMQVDRSWLSVLFTVFRNSSMSYTRQLYDAMRNIGHRLTPGYKGMSQEFMSKQMRRDGIDPDQADRNAKREYRRGIIRDLVKVGVFGYILQFAWNLGAYLPYLILGDNDEEKDKMMDDVFNHSMFGSIEGLTGGDVMSAAGNMWLSGDGNPAYLTKDMPLASDVLSILKKMDKDQVSAMNDVINLCVQSGFGVNPQSLTDAVTAVMDFCGDDAETSRECALLMARVFNCPQSQIDKIYFDEIDATGTEASRMSPDEIAERYARYKMLREAPLTKWLRSKEENDSIMEAKKKKVLKMSKEKIDERINGGGPRKLLQENDSIRKRDQEISKLYDTDPSRYNEEIERFNAETDWNRYWRVRQYKQDIKELTETFLRAKNKEEADAAVLQMREARDRMLEDVRSIEK